MLLSKESSVANDWGVPCGPGFPLQVRPCEAHGTGFPLQSLTQIQLTDKALK